MSADPKPAATTGFRLQTHHEGDDTVIRCAGSLTIEHAAVLKNHGKSVIPEARRLVLDLKEVSRMDSAGLGAVVSLYVSAKKVKCEFLLVNYNQSVKDLLGISHLLSVFETCAQSGIRFM